MKRHKKEEITDNTSSSPSHDKTYASELLQSGLLPGNRTSLDRRILNVTEVILSNCPQPVGFFWANRDGHLIKIPAPCKRWDCPTCGEQKKNALLDGIRDGCLRITNSDNEYGLEENHRFIRHMVLTQHIDDETDICLAWARLRSYLAKRGIRLRFKWVKEFTKRGKRHLHVLINQHVPQRTIATAWRFATEGKSKIVYITRWSEKIKNPGAYLAKYITKGFRSGAHFRRHEHRHGSDRKTDWKPETIWKRPSDLNWTFVYVPTPYRGVARSGRGPPAGDLPGGGPPGRGPPGRGPPAGDLPSR